MTRGLTLKEQERRAYASGDPSAPLLALALDGDEALADHVEMLEQMEQEQRDRRHGAEAKLRAAEKRIEAARAVLNGDRVVAP